MALILFTPHHGVNHMCVGSFFGYLACGFLKVSLRDSGSVNHKKRVEKALAGSEKSSESHSRY